MSLLEEIKQNHSEYIQEVRVYWGNMALQYAKLGDDRNLWYSNGYLAFLTGFKRDPANFIREDPVLNDAWYMGYDDAKGSYTL